MSIPAVQGHTLAGARTDQSSTGTDLVRWPDQDRLNLETQQLAAGIRLVSALLCLGTVLRDSVGVRLGLELLAPLGFSLWAAARWWRTRSAGAPRLGSVADSLIDVLWVGLMLHTTVGIEPMLLVTLIQPLFITTLVLGPGTALLMGSGVIATVLMDAAFQPPSTGLLHLQNPELSMALAVALVTVCSTVLVRPIAALRQRRLLLLQRVDGIDPRRGLDATTAQIARLLRQMSGGPIVALALPNTTGGPAWFSSEAEGDFPASASTHRQIERLLADLPDQVLSDAPRQLHVRLLGLGKDAHPSTGRAQRLLSDLARLLQVEHLTIIPLLRDGHCRGHALLGWNQSDTENECTRELIEVAPELVRLIDSAELVDLLQDEAAGHERSRIGRDLHDSAIQPYLGLKFAVESVAQRAETDNPLRHDLDELARLVNSEITALRELVSMLRTGGTQGDNALVPALRRLVRRFSQLFGIEVQLDCPATLNTSRALAGTLFQMLNEALNNVRKHTGARRVWIRLAHQEAALHLHIRDNAGSILGRRLPDFVPATLAERVADLGGTLDIGHADGLDTELHITVPDRP